MASQGQSQAEDRNDAAAGNAERQETQNYKHWRGRAHLQSRRKEMGRKIKTAAVRLAHGQNSKHLFAYKREGELRIISDDRVSRRNQLDRRRPVR